MILNKKQQQTLDLHYITDNRLSSASFSQDNITQIIQNSYKAHGHDNISTCMLKICGSSIYKPLEMIFKQCIEKQVLFLRKKGKKSNIVPIHKKGDKQTLKITVQCRSYVFVILLFKKILKFLIENKLISSNQFGF